MLKMRKKYVACLLALLLCFGVAFSFGYSSEQEVFAAGSGNTAVLFAGDADKDKLTPLQAEMQIVDGKLVSSSEWFASAYQTGNSISAAECVSVTMNLDFSHAVNPGYSLYLLDSGATGDNWGSNNFVQYYFAPSNSVVVGSQDITFNLTDSFAKQLDFVTASFTGFAFKNNGSNKTSDGDPITVKLNSITLNVSRTEASVIFDDTAAVDIVHEPTKTDATHNDGKVILSQDGVVGDGHDGRWSRGVFQTNRYAVSEKYDYAAITLSFPKKFASADAYMNFYLLDSAGTYSNLLSYAVYQIKENFASGSRIVNIPFTSFFAHEGASTVPAKISGFGILFNNDWAASVTIEKIEFCNGQVPAAIPADLGAGVLFAGAEEGATLAVGGGSASYIADENDGAFGALQLTGSPWEGFALKTPRSISTSEYDFIKFRFWVNKALTGTEHAFSIMLYDGAFNGVYNYDTAVRKDYAEYNQTGWYDLIIELNISAKGITQGEVPSTLSGFGLSLRNIDDVTFKIGKVSLGNYNYEKVSTSSQLLSALANTAREEIILTSDITLTAPLNITRDITFSSENGNALTVQGGSSPSNKYDFLSYTASVSAEGAVLKFEDITLAGQGLGISADSASSLILNNVKLKGFDTGVYLEGTYTAEGEVLFENCFISLAAENAATISTVPVSEIKHTMEAAATADPADILKIGASSGITFTLVAGGSTIPLDGLGNYTANATVNVSGIKAIPFKIKITVADLQPPVITAENKNIEIGSEIDLFDYIEVTDNHTAAANIIVAFITTLPDGSKSVSNALTLSASGIYTVKVSAEDEAGKKSEKEFTITVADTVAPVIHGLDVFKAKYNIGDKIDISEVYVTDNFQVNPTLEIKLYRDGTEVTFSGIEITLTEAGNYKLVFKASDGINTKEEEVSFAIDAPPANKGCAGVMGTSELSLVAIFALLALPILFVFKKRKFI